MELDIYNIKDIQNIKFDCIFCNQSFRDTEKLGLHMIECKNKHIIKDSGLYVMWNRKFIDDKGNIFFKIGRTSSRCKRLSSYTHEYSLSKSEIFFIYEVEVDDEKFAEKFLFYLLRDFRIDNRKELFMTSLENIIENMDFVQKSMKGKIIEKNLKKNLVLKSYFNQIIQKSCIDNEQNQENIQEIDSNDEKIDENKQVNQVNNQEIDSNDEKIDENKKIYQCQYCDRIMACKRNLILHENNVCKVKGKCKCDLCGKQFLSIKYLERHKKVCLANLTCNICGKTLSRKQTYIRHVKKCKK